MRLPITATLVLLLALPARADDDNFRPVSDPLVKAECGACHLAFQPGLLPARSWRGIMAGLENHFGEDASLDADTARSIEAYLTANAADSGWFGKIRRIAGSPAPLRITEMGWFRDEHGESEVTRMVKRRKVETLADCAACHRGADRGYYDDD